MVSSNYFSWWCWRKMEIVATRDLWILVQIIRVTWWEFDTRNGNAAECYLPCSFCCNGVLDSVVWMLRFLNMISCQAFGGPSFFIRSQSLFGLFPAYPKKKKTQTARFSKTQDLLESIPGQILCASCLYSRLIIIKSSCFFHTWLLFCTFQKLISPWASSWP